MAVRQIKKTWWVDFRSNHIRYRKRSPENTRAGALAYEAVLRQRLARGESLDLKEKSVGAHVLFEDFAKVWLTDYVVPNNKFSEQRAKRYILDASLVPFFGRLEVQKITAQQIEQYKSTLVTRGITNKTIRNRLTVLNKCLTCAYEWLSLDSPPPKTNWPKSLPPRTDYLTPEEIDQLLSHASGIVYEMILTTLRTGMRLGEVTALQWTAIDWYTRTIAVRHSFCSIRKVLDTPKNNRVRHIPIDPQVEKLLFARRRRSGHVFSNSEDVPFSNGLLNAQLARTCRRADLRTITWHTLRHTFASHLAMKGTPLNVVQALLGHSSITTTMRYAHVAPSSLRQAIALLDQAHLHQDFGQPVGNHWLLQQKTEKSNLF